MKRLITITTVAGSVLAGGAALSAAQADTGTAASAR